MHELSFRLRGTSTERDGRTCETDRLKTDVRSNER